MKRFRIKYSCISDGDDSIEAEDAQIAEALWEAQFKPEDDMQIHSITEIKERTNETTQKN